jgi:diadenosine tetraphosphate (Ap4A) HIT family hydrolase
VTVFAAEIAAGSPRVPPTGEIAEVAWFALDDIPEPTTNVLPAVLRDLRSGTLGARRHVPNRSWPRVTLDVDSYVERVRRRPCFVCGIVQGRSDHHVVYETERYIAFLNRFPTVYGYTLFAPKEHVTGVTRDLTEDAYADLQRHVHRVAEAVREETTAERIYLLSLGSDQGNAHVHWHIAPLPLGTPYEQQQFEALRAENGILDIPDEVQVAFAARVRERVNRGS